jgi:hypothetical protein
MLNVWLDVDEASAARAQSLRDKLDDPRREIAQAVRDGAEHTWRETAADPARMLREVKAKRDLIAAILAEKHDWVAGDEFYSCSQAVDYAGLNHESREPGSACSDPDRAGQPCDCGRDARVERLLRILAGIYEEAGR